MVDTTSLLQPKCVDCGINLKLEMTDGLPPVLADAVQLTQVLINLVQNAIDSMTNGAAVGRGLVVRTEANGGNEVRGLCRGSRLRRA